MAWIMSFAISLLGVFKSPHFLQLTQNNNEKAVCSFTLNLFPPISLQNPLLFRKKEARVPDGVHTTQIRSLTPTTQMAFKKTKDFKQLQV